MSAPNWGDHSEDVVGVDMHISLPGAAVRDSAVTGPWMMRDERRAGAYQFAFFAAGRRALAVGVAVAGLAAAGITAGSAAALLRAISSNLASRSSRRISMLVSRSASVVISLRLGMLNWPSTCVMVDSRSLRMGPDTDR